MLAARYSASHICRTRTADADKVAFVVSRRAIQIKARRDVASHCAFPLHSRSRRSRGTAVIAASAAPSSGAGEGAAGVAGTSNWRKGLHLAKQAAGLVKNNVWPVVILFSACDLGIFVLHRICHRIVNEAAIRFLLPPQLGTAEALGGSLWWLSNNADIANFQTGYQWLVLLGFLLMFPISVLLRTFAASTSLLVAAENLESEQKLQWLPPIKKIAGQLSRHAGTVKSILTRLWQVDLLVAVRAIPLQGMCLLVVPIPWVLPWLLNLQLATPVSMFEGEFGDDAVKASRRVVQPVRSALAFPFVGLLLTSKLLAFVGRIMLTQLSPRIARDVPEIPIGIYAVVGIVTLVLSRIQDMLPLVTYIEAKRAYGAEAKLEVVP